ncbi:hypothetical protein EAH72_11785 [Pseudomonas caspiana]|uniref:Uncharacterized protein n=1 Tax=Pseudomonas mandelii TaxID=75612 RepID=A0A502ICG0_9PSED|nr:hypothetical protein EAH74_15680 [Pseudomonas mandelii]TPG96165.1 hypothetical protein EAH72_11785 [Pseudomonas caspiana]
MGFPFYLPQIIPSAANDRSRLHADQNVGASLLAKASCQPTSMLNVITSSRAGRIAAPSLPQVLCTPENSDESPHEKR